MLYCVPIGIYNPEICVSTYCVEKKTLSKFIKYIESFNNGKDNFIQGVDCLFQKNSYREPTYRLIPAGQYVVVSHYANEIHYFDFGDKELADSHCRRMPPKQLAGGITRYSMPIPPKDKWQPTIYYQYVKGKEKESRQQIQDFVDSYRKKDKLQILFFDELIPKLIEIKYVRVMLDSDSLYTYSETSKQVTEIASDNYVVCTHKDGLFNVVDKEKFSNMYTFVEE
jgi:hypothetical protein